MRLSARLVAFTAILSTALTVLAAAEEGSEPVIELPPGNMTALEGEEVILECAAAGTPTPTLSWLYQGQPLVNDSGRLEILETGGLLIVDVKEFDSGIYSCVAASDAGNAIATGNLVVVGKAQAADIQFGEGSIRAGAGYSTDKQQIVAQACYNVVSSSTAGQEVRVELDKTQSFSQMEKELGASVSVKGSYGMFSADASANYLRSVQNKEYSSSLNYFAKYTNKVTLQLAGGGKEKALTETGRSFYNNNKYFGLVCGDQYIASYDQGVLLAMGINIIFSNSESKQKFDANVAASYGNMVSAAGNISGKINELNIQGSVMIQALQIGGEPSQLSKMLNKDGDGKYYAITCSLTEMESCIRASSGLLDYARNELPKQFEFEKNKGLTPVGLGVTRYNPADEIGLKIPASVVTPEIDRIRKELADKYEENEYYKQKLHNFLEFKGYPLALDEDFRSKVNNLFQKVDRNIMLLMQPHGGAADCFNKPLQCKEIKRIIYSYLQPVTKDDISFIDRIKYIGSFQKFQENEQLPFMPNGKDESWYETMFEEMKRIHTFWNIQRAVFDEERSGKVRFTLYMGVNGKPYSYTGTLTHSRGKEETYEGDMVSEDGNVKFPHKIIRKISPFFFEAYKPSR